MASSVLNQEPAYQFKDPIHQMVHVWSSHAAVEKALGSTAVQRFFLGCAEGHPQPMSMQMVIQVAEEKADGCDAYYISPVH